MMARVLSLIAVLATVAADYGDPRKGCATGDMPAKFPFGGCMCMPKCTAGKCPAAPGATAIPTCEFSSTGKPPPDYCGLRCKNGETCPTGTTCEMPTGICAFPYPQGEPEDLDAAALASQLTEVYSALEPQLEQAGLAVNLGTEEGSDSAYEDCDLEIFVAQTGDDGMCNEGDKNKPLYSGSCKELASGGVETITKAVTADFPVVGGLLAAAINNLFGKSIEDWCTENVCNKGCPSMGGLVLWPHSPCEAEVEPTGLLANYGVYMHVKCSFPWGGVLLLGLLALCCCGGCFYMKRRKNGPARWGPQNSLQQPFRDSMF